MEIRSFAFGLGNGIILMAVLIYIFYGLTLKTVLEDSELASAAMTEEEIMARAEELGMIMSDEPLYTELSESEIIERAKELGMDFFVPFDDSFDDTLIISPDEYSDQEVGADETEGEEENNDADPPEEEPEVPDETPQYRQCTIEPGMNAQRIARLLYENGVITDQIGFLRFLSENNKTRLIKSGRYSFRVGMSFEEIYKLIVIS